MGGIKKTIQSVLINKAHRKYKKELLRAGEGYEIYAEAMRKSLAEKYSANGSKMIPQILTETEVPAFAARLKHLSADDSKFVIFTTDRSVLSPVAGDVFASFFEETRLTFADTLCLHFWGISSFGRALGSQSRGDRFEPDILHEKSFRLSDLGFKV